LHKAKGIMYSGPFANTSYTGLVSLLYIAVTVTNQTSVSTYRPSDRRTETYTGRVGALLLIRTPTNVRKKYGTDRRTDGQTSDRYFTLSATDAASVAQ